MGLENKPWDCFPSENKSEIPQPALKEQERTSFAQRVFSCVPYAWRLALAGAVISGGLNLSRVEPASADTSNNPSTITEVFRTAAPLTETQKQQIPADFAVEGGRHFFTQTRGNAEFPQGYLMQGDFYGTLLRLGGVPLLGYPVGSELTIDGLRVQPTQNGLLQDNPRLGFVLANIMDIAHGKGLDNWLYAQGVPHHFSGDDGSKGNFEEAKRIRLSWLTNPQIKDKYFQNPNPSQIPQDKWDPITFFGLPTSKPEDRGAFIAQRFQRGIILYWKKDVPGGQPAGTVQYGNVGDLLKLTGLYGKAAIPIDNPFGTGGGNGNGGVNGNGTGTEIFAPELPYPPEIGELQKDGIVVHNMGKTQGLVLKNQDYFQNYLGKIAKRFFPGGVEYLVSDLSSTDYGKLLDPIRSNPNYEKKLLVATDWNSYNAAYKNSTMYGAINKTTGRLEIYINLPILSGKPTQENAPQPDVNEMISYTLRLGLIWSAGGPFNNDPQIWEWRQSVKTPGSLFLLASKG